MTSHSSLEELNQVIRDYNPFESHFVVKAHHVWDEEFPDVAVLNAHASEAVLEAVDKINSGRSASKTVGFALLAPKGTGKTHVLSRIRQTLKRKGNGFFVYMCEYGNLNQVRCQFLQSLASSLKKVGSQGVTQWQELATALINQAMNKTYVAQTLIAQFPKALAQKPQLVNQLAIKIHQSCPNIDNPYIIKAILWTLSQAHAPFAISWLAGRDLSDAQAKMMDLPNSGKEDKDIEAFNTTRQILELISYYTTPVICFDQLDGTEVADEEDITVGGFTRAQVVATLAMDLYNNLKRGILISALYKRTWQEIQALSVADAAPDRIANHEIELQPLKPDDVVLLVSNWLETFYNQHNLTPLHVLYPFEEAKLRELGEERPTVREVLQWCAKNFSPVVIDPNKQLEKIYQEIENQLEDYSDDNEKIANALAFGLQQLKGQTLEGVTIQDLDREVRPKGRHRGNINFRILGEENGDSVKIGVCVCQSSHGKTVGAAVKYLTWYKDFDLTRGCLVRSKSIASHWRIANEHRDQLLNQQGGEWVSFKDEEIKPLLTLHQMFKELDREVFSDADFRRFIDEKHPLNENALIREILSDPSGQAPSEVIDEDDELEKLLSQEVTTSEGEDSEDLDLLEVA